VVDKFPGIIEQLLVGGKIKALFSVSGILPFLPTSLAAPR
jgi:hypothetical protein